jgi:acyl-CoA hydrolase
MRSSDQPKASRPVAASLTTMTEYVLPTHANAVGNVFGGQILAWVDLCAAICAQRHTGHTAITAGIDEVSFEKPIRVGQVVRLTARMTAAFHTSVEILVEVEGEEATSGARWPCVTAFVTYVAVDEKLSPTRVPALELETEEEHDLAAAALERRKSRLAKRKWSTSAGQ